MRRFVVVGHKATSSGDFRLDDLAGGAGRLDVLLRCVNSSFFISHDIRRDVEARLVLQGDPRPPRTVRIMGSEVKYLNPDERSTGALFRNALLREDINEVRSSPGIYVSNMSFMDNIEELSKKSKLVYLKESGTDIRSSDLTDDMTFILSDHMDLSSEEESSLLSYSPMIVRLGPLSYHADHCITIMNNELDRRTE